MSETQFPSILMIMLCHRCTLGGAEKRYARVFEMLVDKTDAQHRLLIGRPMLDLLQSAGILLDRESHMIIADSLLYPLSRSKGKAWRFLLPLAWLLDTARCAWQCWAAIRRHRPDVVHSLLTGMYLSLPALLLSPTVRAVISAYSPKFGPIRSKGRMGIRLGGAIKRYAMQRSHAIDALSTSIRNDLIVRGFDGDRIYVAPCSFTDPSSCKPDPQKRKWVVFLARFIDEKNPLLLAAAIPKVINRVPDAHFYFLGRGYLREQLEELLRKTDVADHATIGFEPRPTAILSQSSIFASLQTDDNYPSQSLLEAMACANAIVATDVGETWRLVDEANGRRVPPETDAVAGAIAELLDDPKLSQYQAVSRQRVLTDHTRERFFSYITSVYRAVAAPLH